MNTSSSGTPYRHPVVHVDQVEFRADYGWYAHIFHQCSNDQLKIEVIKAPNYDNDQMFTLVNASPQVSWIEKQFT